jgi:hypothetical protein
MLSKQKALAARRALKTRLDFGYPLGAPCDVFELISQSGLSLRFTGTSSLAGMFLNDGVSSEIVVSALRPAGHQHFTAAHEFGHYQFGHGAKLDGEIEDMVSDSEEEALADAFARHLLMPQRAVVAGLSHLGTTAAAATPMQLYSLSSWLGVGYTTLVNQMKWTLGMISSPRHHELSIKQPQQIKRSIVPEVLWAGRRELWPLAPWWRGSGVHLQVGDVLTGLPRISSPLLEFKDGYAIATSCGQITVKLEGDCAVHLSIAKADYVGLFKFRYLEEPTDA